MSDEAGDDDDLQPTGDHTARNALIGLAVLGLAAGGAWFVNDRNDAERRATGLRAASAAWNDLARCLAGDRWRVGEVAAVSRHRELSIPRSVRDLPEAERLRVWPWRCAAPAQRLTRALFESRSEAAGHRLLSQFSSVAATELARGALRTGANDPRHYLDELFAAAQRAGLPDAPPSTVELPPEPVRYLDPRRVRPIYRGGGSVVMAEQPLDDGALRVLVGRGEARLCDFDRELDAPDCTRVRALDGARRPALTSALYPRMPGYLTRLADDELAVGALLHPGHPDSPLALNASGALRVGQDAWIVASRVGEGPAAHFELGPGVTFAGAVTPPRVLGGVVVSFADAPSPPVAATGDGGVGDAGDAGDASGDASGDAGAPTERTLLAGLVAESLPARWVVPPSSRGTLRSAAREALVRACRMGDATAAAAYGEDGRALVLWARNGALTARAVEARPGAFACHDGRLRLAWYTNVPRPVVHALTCTADGCAAAEGAFVFTEVAPRLAVAGDRVLAAYTQDGAEGLRYRFAPLDGLAAAPEVVVFDDSAHGGVKLEAAPTVLARGESAVILATGDDATRETWAIRVDARGYRALRPRE
ncbi:MAG: hypothetical protein U0324_15650 [Polyangiales bacterium]